MYNCPHSPLPEFFEVGGGGVYTFYRNRPGNRVINAEFWSIVGIEFTLQTTHRFYTSTFINVTILNFKSVVASYHCYSNFLVYIVQYCNSIRKLTMAQELPKHVFSQI